MSRPTTTTATTLQALVAAVVVLLALVAGAADGAAAGEPVAYRPPVAGAVTDPFRAPPTPYGAGNRGLEYDTRAGTPVRAAAAGTVGFAGQVGGRLYVSVDHADGVRTTYGPLGRVSVRRGAAVAAGAVVGVAGGDVLWTARLGGAYLDPAALLEASGDVRVRLVRDRPRARGVR